MCIFFVVKGYFSQKHGYDISFQLPLYGGKIKDASFHYIIFSESQR